MIRVVNTPHLPKGEVRHIIIGEKYRDLLENAICSHNLEAFWMPDNPFVDPRMSGHADISAAHAGKNIIILREYLKNSEFINNLEQAGFEICYIDNPAEKSYPYDAELNFCAVDDKLIHNEKTAVKIDTSEYNHIIRVNQGYTRCSVCVVNESSIITADKSIAEKSKSAGMNVLQIDSGFVKLDGFEYGFIGGASFKLNEKEIAFTGLIRDRKNKELIESFINKCNVKPVYLTDEDIFDIGSAVLLTEEV